ncbi:carboxymuconolactone decarboxylase family protein [Phytohabitans sp. ZYX-F-186]|uniref:Carboxymuconolactone decarboxylase family protein n=1 Tax=Phytohabitans maris TaxID=3071409 RepID=A0ABU0ZEC7_9ACTN|nr:carboxymuconolactone decarboxylase family protein [Phytohabitans sp. ZYX-F-186]MDQ7904791.1 carboxymuconolactone decarboxylase family protein [Phytohabitans sp. ZYX-F-186]
MTPERLTAAQQDLYAEITGGDRAAAGGAPVPEADGALPGPFNAMLLSPVLGDALQRLGSAIRYHGTLPSRAREIAILTVAAHHDCAFEWRTHEPIARDAGLNDADLAAVRAMTALPDPNPYEAAVQTLTRRLLRYRGLDDEAYAAAVATVGAPALFEVVTLVGYYSLLALQMDVFAVS